MKLIQIHPDDNVAVALEDVKKGETVSLNGEILTAGDEIPRGHKIALTDISRGESVIKYGCRIAVAKEAIAKGSRVHTHNAGTALTPQGEYHYNHRIFPQPVYTEKQKAEKTFMGYRRPDGKAGIRNELWILPLVGCVNGIARQLTEQNQDLAACRGGRKYQTIDGLYYFPHPFGCSQLGDDLTQTKRVLASLAHHPNAGGVLCLGLGCENLQMDLFREALGDYDPERIRFLVCQDVGDELAEGRKILCGLADYARRFERQPLPASDLVVGLKCGGSDGLSGITANPAVGRFSDRLTALGGTTILTEVPEMFGAENLLFSRCRDQETFERAVRMVTDFKKYFTDHGQAVYENPSPGNKKGGITTLEDKSCGCIQKGGSAQIVDILDYAEPVKRKGLNLLSGPGNDLVSTTDLTAAGAQMILFTTGRGTPFGAPAPTVKISTNTELYQRKRGWIDFDAGTIAEGLETPDATGERLLSFCLQIASGAQTESEKHGNREISIFKDGVVL